MCVCNLHNIFIGYYNRWLTFGVCWPQRCMCSLSVSLVLLYIYFVDSSVNIIAWHSTFGAISISVLADAQAAFVQNSVAEKRLLGGTDYTCFNRVFDFGAWLLFLVLWLQSCDAQIFEFYFPGWAKNTCIVISTFRHTNVIKNEEILQGLTWFASHMIVYSDADDHSLSSCSLI
jgi:hypothetical protein